MDVLRPDPASRGDLDLTELSAGFLGRLLTPGTDGYDERRQVWNGTVDKRPALITECSGTADVIAAVNFARAKGLPVSVRGGGHNVAGTAVVDAGVVIDLWRMHAVRVDPIARTARVEGGATLGRLDHEAQAFGLAAPAGVMSKTGIAGLTLHGGLGFLTRKHGLTCDNLIAADVVTADGRLVTASETSNQELLWALRGGGGNFGVVTSFEFKLHPIGPEVWMAVVMYPGSEAHKVVSFFRDKMADAPDELMAIAIYWNTPHDESLPEAVRNVPTIAIGGCYCGPVEKGEEAIRPFREIAEPLIDLSGRMPYAQAQQLFDPEYPDGRRYYWKSIYLNDLTKGTIDELTSLADKRPSKISSLDIWALGGAMGRTPQSHAAFEGRKAPFLLGIEANWNGKDDDAANVAWAREAYDAMARRFPKAGSYLNFAGSAEEGAGLAHRTFDANLERLRAVKERFDPHNLFRSNVNIAPKRAG